jgi:hypothetical protein
LATQEQVQNFLMLIAEGDANRLRIDAVSRDRAWT